MTNFFSSETGVAISWLCTVIGFIFAIFQSSQKIKIHHKNIELQKDCYKMQTEITNLNQKIFELENSEIHNNKQHISQTGKNNVNQGVVKGDVHLDLH